MDEFNQYAQVPVMPLNVQNTPYSAPMYNYGSSIILLTNPENELYKMELTLRGMILDKDSVPRQAGEPLLNERGISRMIGLAQTIVNQVTIMSNLDKHDIRDVMIDFLGDTLAKELMLNRRTYNINTVSARDTIFFTVLSSSFICMQRALDGDDKRFWKGSQQDITMRTEGQKQGKGLLSQFLGWGKQ